MADTATPRPWEVMPGSDNGIRYEAGRETETYGTIYGDGWHLALVFADCPDLKKSAPANARLIVEAVNAHDALKAENARLTQGLQNIVARYQSRDPDSAVAGDMHDIARATLEGR